MKEETPDSNEPKDGFEYFARSIGFIGLIGSWVLVYFFIISPWETASRHVVNVVYSITAIGITVFVALCSIVLLVGGVHGARVISNMSTNRYGWRQIVFMFAWACVTFGIYTLLQTHLRQNGYGT